MAEVTTKIYVDGADKITAIKVLGEVTVSISDFAPQAVARLVYELAAALRKATANLRDAIEDAAKAWGRPEPVLQAALEKNGVLEAEALLKRIDEGTS